MSSLFAGFEHIGASKEAEKDGQAESESAPSAKGDFIHGPVAATSMSKIRASATRTIVKSLYNFPVESFNERMREELTLTPKGGGDKPPPPYEAFIRRGPWICAPRFWGLAVFGEPMEDRLADGAKVDLTFSAGLRDYQVPAVDAVMTRLRAAGTAANGAMLVAGCGTGKTVMSIAAACALGRKTAILCHNSMLITQWAERVHEFVGESPGVVQRDRVEHDRPIVLFMIASVISGRYDGTGIFDDFGLVIVDECHHIAAKTFMDSLSRFPARARLGLTATPDRRDGLGKAVEWLLGPVVYTVKRRPNAEVQVRMLRHARGPTKELHRYGKPDFVAMVTRSVRDHERTMAICRLARQLFTEGRRVIVLSGRKDHLREMHEALGEELSGLYVGETSKKAKRAREDSKDKPIMLATNNMGEEGLDVPILSALILATPKSSLGGIEQAVGRVLRSHPEKFHAPLIVDVWDPVGMFEGMMRKRERYFKAQGFAISHADLEYDDCDPQEADCVT